MDYIMVELLFKTRAGSDPHGKPKVYFSAHAEDFHLLEPISEEILVCANCAVWYDGDPCAPKDVDELLSLLDEMNLFVIPVTERWLTQESRSISVEFAYAKKHHIPILPIMQEEGLVELFNQKCGDIQFLDPAAQDKTAIPYKEKLDRFLNSVLVGDELSAKIRAAFDAYIFLSYRKKDRKFAKELMRLIHANDFCRDIAIWYDEFLIPGEDFNRVIEKALEKSSLFALAVTPNMVNESNYVMNIEYPMAKKAGKEIIAAEIVATDKEKLRECFEGLPDAVDVNDGELLSKNLREAFRSVALLENDGDPEHNFFIGLAYLSGIDVERDPERAISLITSSAEAGLPEAIARLVTIYQNAEGTERDYEKAIFWQKKLCEARLEQFQKSGLEKDALTYVHDCVVQGEIYDMLSRNTEAEMLYWLLLERVRSFGREYGFSSMPRCEVVCLNQLGKIAELNGKSSRAFKFYKSALAILEGLPDTEKSRDHAWVYTSLGSASLANERLDEAQQYYEKALEIFIALLQKKNTPFARLDIAHAHDMLGRIAERLLQFDEALAHYEKSFELCHSAAEESQDAGAYRREAFALKNIGDIYEQKQELERAAEYMIRSVALRQVIAEQNDSVMSKRDLALGQSSLGAIYKALGRYDRAYEYFEMAYKLRREIYDKTDTVDSKRELSLSLNELGDIAYLFGLHDAAKKYFDDALRLREDLALKVETPSAKYDLISSYNRIGDLLQIIGRSEEALEYHQKALTLATELAQTAAFSAAKEYLFHTYCFVGRAYERLDDAARVCENYEKAAEIAEQLAKESDSFSAQRNLSISLGQLGRASELGGNYEKAAELYERSSEILERLLKSHQTYELLRDSATNFTYLGRLNFGLKKWERSLEYWEKAIAYYEELYSTTQTDVSQRDLLYAYDNIGRVFLAVSDPERAVEYLEKARTLVEKLAANEGSGYSGEDVFVVLDSLSDAYEMMEDFDSQLKVLDRLLEISREEAEKSGNLWDRNRVGKIYSKMGYAFRSSGALEKALESFAYSLEIREALYEVSDATELLDDLAHSHFDMGSILISLHSKEARGFLSRAVEILDILIDRCPEDSLYSRLSSSIKIMLFMLPE